MTKTKKDSPTANLSLDRVGQSVEAITLNLRSTHTNTLLWGFLIALMHRGESEELVFSVFCAVMITKRKSPGSLLDCRWLKTNFEITWSLNFKHLNLTKGSKSVCSVCQTLHCGKHYLLTHHVSVKTSGKAFKAKHV